MVVSNIEKTVSPVPEWLMYLKKQTNCFHKLFITELNL